MKKLLLILLILSSFYVKGDIHQIQVWNGYYQFLPSNNITVQLGDTVQWVQLDPPTMTHTITSDNIPNGAIPFDQIWQLPADTFFQYIPQVVGLYQYVCTPHITFGMIGEFTVVNGLQSYVPDDNFETYLENNGMGNGVYNDDSVYTANINTVITLDISNQNITDLIGIEDFANLIYLMCNGNQLTSLDVSNNIALATLNCKDNQLTSLDISQNTDLTKLICGSFYSSSGNQLTSLDVSQNIALTQLQVDNNQLTNLNVSSNTSLTILTCSQNQFTSLDVSNNTFLTELNCHQNQLTSLDVSNNTSLTWLMFSYNSLTSIDVSNNTALNYLGFSHNQLNNIDINTNIALTNLSCNHNQLSSLDVSHNILLEILHCGNNLLTEIDLSNQNLLEELGCRSNHQLTELNVKNGNNVNFEHFEVSDNINLYCINVDDSTWATVNWSNNIDPHHYFSTNCSGTTAIEENTTNKELLKVTDLLVRETKQTNQPLFYIYDDGTVEKRIVVE